MRLPDRDASTRVRRRYGRYCQRKLVLARLPGLASAVEIANAELARWKEAVSEISAAEITLQLARDRRDRAIEDWEKVMQATYGVLLGKMAKARAERFFPRVVRPGRARKRRGASSRE